MMFHETAACLLAFAKTSLETGPNHRNDTCAGSDLTGMHNVILKRDENQIKIIFYLSVRKTFVILTYLIRIL